MLHTESLCEIALGLFGLEKKAFILVGAELHRHRRCLSIEVHRVHRGHLVPTFLAVHMSRHFIKPLWGVSVWRRKAREVVMEANGCAGSESTGARDLWWRNCREKISCRLARG